MQIYQIHIPGTGVIRNIKAKDVPSAKYKFYKVTHIQTNNLIIKKLKSYWHSGQCLYNNDKPQEIRHCKYMH